MPQPATHRSYHHTRSPNELRAQRLSRSACSLRFTFSMLRHSIRSLTFRTGEDRIEVLLYFSAPPYRISMSTQFFFEPVVWVMKQKNGKGASLRVACVDGASPTLDRMYHRPSEKQSQSDNV